MSIKFPKEIKIGYATFKVKHTSRKSIESAGAFGDTQFNESIINIYGNQADEEAVNTTLHELLHSINYIFSIKHKNAREEERYVRHMANALTTVFRDNPNLLLWIKKNLKDKK